MGFFSWLSDGLSHFNFVGKSIESTKKDVAKKMATDESGMTNVNKQKAIENGTWFNSSSSSSSSDSSSSSSSSDSSSSSGFSDFSGITKEVLENMLNAYATSAVKAEEQSLTNYKTWSEEQADLAWQRTLDSVNSQMAFQAEQQQKSMDFQERMSNTAYQRAVKDLKAAGLNPILAVTNGSASTPTVGVPSGSSASAQMANTQKADYSTALKTDKYVDIYSALGSLLSSAGKLISSGIPDFIKDFFKK